MTLPANITPTDFADVTAKATFTAAVANVTAVKRSPLLRSGFVNDARNGAIVTGSGAAASIQFPYWDGSAIGIFDLPLDGSQVTEAQGAANFHFAAESVVRKIIPIQYMKQPILESVMTMAQWQAKYAERAGNLLSGTLEQALMDSAIAEAERSEDLAGNTISPRVADIGPLTYGGIIDAVTTYLGADWEPEQTAMIMDPTSYALMLQNPDVTRAQTSGITDLAGKPLPAFLGMPLIMTSYGADPITGAPEEPATHTILVVRKGNLQVWMDNRLTESEEYHIPSSGTWGKDLFANYAVHASYAYGTGSLLIRHDGRTPTP